MKTSDYNDIDVLDKLLKLWVNSVDCIGLECKNCNKNEICIKICEIFKQIEEIKDDENI